MYFVDKNTDEVAKGLLAALEDLQKSKYPMESSSRHYLSDLVTWAMHELHERGNPTVVEITRPIVQTNAKPKDPRISTN